MNRILNKKILYILSFTVPFMMYLVIGIVLRLYPISDNTLIYEDLNNQFIGFFTFFKNLFTTNNDFLYTFSKNLGGDMMGFSAYYLQNPFLFLLFLFPYKLMPLGIYLMEIIMLSLSGFTFMVFLFGVFGDEEYGVGRLLFSTGYAMMEFVLAYFLGPIWFCNIIILPLVITGFHKMFSCKDSKKGIVLYTVSLALAMFLNYYMGYMLCLFLALYFVFYCIYNYETNKEEGASCIVGRFKTFITFSITGVALSCFDLIPVALSLRDQKDAPATSIFEIKRTFSLLQIYKRVLPGGFDLNLSNQSLPYIYVGTVPVLFVGIWFISRKVSLNKKLAAFFLIGTLVLSLYLKPLNTIWHAFNEPVGYAHRFAYYLSFVLLMMGYKGYILFVDFAREKNWRRITLIVSLITAFALGELFYNTKHVFGMEVAYNNMYEGYTQFYDRINPILSEIKSKEGENSLYRVEKDIQYTTVDPMTFDYAGLSHNSSCEKAKVKDFMGKLGFRNQGIWAFYNQGSTAFADSFLGVKYFISRFDETDKPYMNFDNTEDTYVFENPYALKLASIVNTESVNDASAKLTENSSSKLSKANSGISNSGNTFLDQNMIAKCYGLNEDIFSEATVSEIRVYGDVNCGERMLKRAEENKVTVIDIDNWTGDSYEGGTFGGYSEPNEADAEEKTYIEFDVDIKESGETLYMYFDAPFMQWSRIYVNDIDWDDYFSDWRWAVERVGTFNEGDVVTIRIEASSDKLELSDYQLYYEDSAVLGEWYEKACALGSNTVNLDKVKSSYLVGDFTATKDSTLLFTMPYDKGWHVKIDGKRVKQREVLYTLMGVDVEKGQHTIEMRYIPEGLVFGCFVSIVALLFFVYSINDKKKVYDN